MEKIHELEVSLDILKAIHYKELNVDSSMSIIRKGMEIVDKYPDLTGDERKKLLINVLTRVAKVMMVSLERTMMFFQKPLLSKFVCY